MCRFFYNNIVYILFVKMNTVRWLWSFFPFWNSNSKSDLDCKKCEAFVDNLLLIIQARKAQGKPDAYVELPGPLWTIEELRLVRTKLVMRQPGVSCRLYNRYRLQVWWEGCPLSTIDERLYNNGQIITNFTGQLEFFKKIKKNAKE